MNLGQLVGELSLAKAEGGKANAKATAPALEADPHIRQIKRRRDRIVAALEKFGPLKSVEIAQRIGETSKGSLSVELVHMKDCGLIETEGTQGRYLYRLVDA